METHLHMSSAPDRFCAWCGEQIKPNTRVVLVPTRDREPYEVVVLHEECGAALEREKKSERQSNVVWPYTHHRQRGLTDEEWSGLHEGRSIGYLPPGPWFVAIVPEEDEEGYTGEDVYDRSDSGGVFYVDGSDQCVTLAVPTTEAVAHCMAASREMLQLLEDLEAQHRKLNLSEGQVFRIRGVLRKAYGLGE